MIYNSQTISERLRPVFCAYNIRRATLFGSYAKNTATEKSDIDIYVDSGLRGMKFVGFMEKIRERLDGKEVDVLDKAHIEESSRVLSEINRDGILIYAR